MSSFSALSLKSMLEKPVEFVEALRDVVAKANLAMMSVERALVTETRVDPILTQVIKELRVAVGNTSCATPLSGYAARDVRDFKDNLSKDMELSDPGECVSRLDTLLSSSLFGDLSRDAEPDLSSLSPLEEGLARLSKMLWQSVPESFKARDDVESTASLSQGFSPLRLGRRKTNMRVTDESMSTVSVLWDLLEDEGVRTLFMVRQISGRCGYS